MNEIKARLHLLTPYLLYQEATLQIDQHYSTVTGQSLEFFSFHYNDKILEDIFLRDSFRLNLIARLFILIQCV